MDGKKELKKEAFRSPGTVLRDFLLKKMPAPVELGDEVTDELRKLMARAPHQAATRGMWDRATKAIQDFQGDDAARNQFILDQLKATSPSETGTPYRLLDYLNFDAEDVARSRAEASKYLADYGLIGGGVGLGIGAARQLPKLFKTHKELSAIKPPREREKEDKQSPLDRAIFGKTAQAEKPPWSPAPKTPGAPLKEPGPATGLNEWLTDFLGVRSFLDGKAMGAPLPYSGAMWTLLPAAVMAGLVGGDKVTDWATDRMRAKYIKRRKDKVKDQFYNLLQEDMSGTKHASLSSVLDQMAGEYTEKQAAGITPGALPGLGGLVATILAGGALGIGYNVGRGRDPLAQKAKALKIIMAKERMKRMIPLELVATGQMSREELQDMLGDPTGSAYRMPLALATGEDKDEAVDADSSEIDLTDADLFGIGKASAATGGAVAAGAAAPGWLDTLKQKGRAFFGPSEQEIQEMVPKMLTPEAIKSLPTETVDALKKQFMPAGAGDMAELAEAWRQSGMDVKDIKGMADMYHKVKGLGGHFMTGLRQMGDLGGMLGGNLQELGRSLVSGPATKAPPKPAAKTPAPPPKAPPPIAQPPAAKPIAPVGPVQQPVPAAAAKTEVAQGLENIDRTRRATQLK
jgi:hypothetical protein